MDGSCTGSRGPRGRQRDAGRSHGRQEEEEEDEDGPGLPEAIKLGLGDFIFYSVLVGRAAMYDLLTAAAAYLAIIAGGRMERKKFSACFMRMMSLHAAELSEGRLGHPDHQHREL